MIIKIKKANILDIVEIWKLLKNRSSEDVKKFNPMYANSKTRFIIMILLNKIDFYVAVEDRKILGFISIRKDLNNLLAIYVKKEYRNNGVGTKLITFAKKKYKFLCLYINKNSYKTIRLYKKAGFKNSGTNQIKMNYSKKLKTKSRRVR